MVDRLYNRELIAWCAERGIAAQCFEPLGSAILTGAITRETDVDALWGGHLKEWTMFGRLFEGKRFERSMRVVDGLRELAERWNSSIADLAMAWVIAQPGVTAAIAGTANPAHARANAAAGDLELTAEQLAALEALVPLGPAYT
jgi:aryl-alcohol dehydrogenase-like predicted oxidoreductase